MKKSVLIVCLFALSIPLMFLIYGCGASTGGGSHVYVPRIFFIHAIAGWGSAEGISATPTGTDWQTIVPNRGSNTYLNTISLSPNGSKALLLTYNPSGCNTLEVMNADGSGNTVIETAPNVYGIAWAKDSQKIAFVSDLSGPATLYTQLLGGAGPVAISTTSYAQPFFSRSSTYIAYIKSDDIWYRNADGTGSEKPVTATASDESLPCFSPNDDNVLIFCRTEGSNGYVFKVNITNTSEVTNLNPTAPFSDIFDGVASEGILWPAGSSSYVYLCGQRSGDTHYRLYRVPVAGGTPEALTDDDYYAVDLRVFRDANGIFYTRFDLGYPDIYNMEYDGSGQTRITSNETSDLFNNSWYP